tara:strand:+ start:406 stop:1050 length:645 start_codon:yes stop_codon:yes gene_type:complete
VSNVSARVEEIRAEAGDTVEIAQIGDIVSSLMTTIEGDLGVADLRVHRELNELLEFIGQARREIASIHPDRIRTESIQVANDELDAVVAATEEAAGKFLDAAETLENLAGELENETSFVLNDVATQIYEASSFQDITGQRIAKVVGALHHIEERIARLTRVMEDPPETAGHAIAEATETAEQDDHDERDLLNGPAMPDQANSQEDIDALLASFD